MNFLLPTQTTTPHHWEGGELPPLKLVEDEATRPQAAVQQPAVRPSTKPSQPVRTGPWKQLLLLFVVGVLSVMAYFLFSRYVVTPVIIQGRSMAPTLKDGE